MRAHADDRIHIGSAVLDLQSLCSIRIVAAPRLGSPEEHAGVESRAAARAALEEDLGKCAGQLLIEGVHAENIAVHHLALAHCGP